MNWQTVIGLEVHAQLSTRSKLFSGANASYGAMPNAQTSFIDAGLPGVLPVLNQEAVRMAIQFGLAIDAEINDLSFFERKNYFYPDLPKGYQISQFQKPIVSNGKLLVTLNPLRTIEVTIARAHLEEDAGKLLHEAHPAYTGVDLNRAGVALLEIVTTPCLYSAEEAIAYLKTLHQLLRFLGICDGNMQEGSFRCDVNLSLRPECSDTLGTRTELKNLNSFRFIEKAIAYEELRHQERLDASLPIVQETRLYCPDTNRTLTLRLKENENDYRYFPDPDLLAIPITEAQRSEIKAMMPSLPQEIREQLCKEGLLDDDIDFLLTSKEHVLFFEAVKTKSLASAKNIVNWMKGVYTATLKEQGCTFATPPVSPERFACLLDRLNDNTISAKIAKDLFALLSTGNESVDDLIRIGGYQSINQSTDFEDTVRLLVESFPEQANEYRAGKEKLLAFFVGKIMKETKGQADPSLVNTLLKKYLSLTH